MLDIALYQSNGPVFLKDIADRQEVSEKYLWHLIPPLKTAGLINSFRGAHGGYVLAKRTHEITLKDIVCNLEGNLCLVECVENTEICGRNKKCATKDVWESISKMIVEKLQSITLADLVEKQKQLDSSGIINYSI